MSLSFQKRPALVAYVTCGDPDLATTRAIVLAAVEAGAHIIELGVPFSDPVADGPVIQRASERALRHGTSLEQVLKLGKEVRSKSQAGLIIFSYLNPILRLGLTKFSAALEDAGINGALITDLPVEEAGDYVREMRKRRLDTVFLAAPTSPAERLKQIAKASTGFVYAVSRTGVTGARKQLPEDTRDLVRRVRRHTKLPIAVGFGISSAEQFAAVGEFAEAAVVGSAIVETIERNPGKEPEAVAQFVRQLLAGTSQLSAKQGNGKHRKRYFDDLILKLTALMDIADWRKKIDELDRRLVELLNQRAQAAHEIGKLKRDVGMPIYEPDREQAVFGNVRKLNQGPLPDRDLLRIYERIMDVMRQIQKEEIAPQAAEELGATELDSEVND